MYTVDWTTQLLLSLKCVEQKSWGAGHQHESERNSCRTTSPGRYAPFD